MTPQEKSDFFDAIEGMDDDTRLSLCNFSAKRLEGSRYDSGTDLLHEAIDRVLSGSRAWERSIPIGAFLYEAMRSIVSVDRRDRKRVSIPIEFCEEAQLRARDDRDDEFSRTPEEMLEARQEQEIRREVLAAAKAGLAHDADAQAVLDGIRKGMEPAEIRAAHALGELAYKSARGRIAMEARRARGSRPPR